MRLKIIYLFTLFFVLGISTYSQSYSYPVRPGDKAWSTFNNSEEMYSACQIPFETLKSMPTKDLVTTCLDYPLINTLYAYNNLQTGFSALTKRFNGIKELLSREDSGMELIKVYSKMSPENYGTDWTDERKGEFTFQFSYIEAFLAQRAILSNLTLTDKKNLVKLCVNKYKAKQKHITIFGTHGISITSWTIARTIEKEVSLIDESSKKNFAKNTFIEHGLVIDFEVVNEIMEKAKNYVK